MTLGRAGKTRPSKAREERNETARILSNSDGGHLFIAILLLAVTGGGAYSQATSKPNALEAIEQQLLEIADSAGFFCYRLAEHHATPLGMAPSPALFLSAAAQRTRRIRLGPLVYLLPLYNPLRLIEEVSCSISSLAGG